MAFVFSDQVSAGLREDSLLMTGARSQQVAVVRASLAQGADVNAQDNMRRTALVWAEVVGREAAVEGLFWAGADISIRESSGISAVEIAPKEGHLSLAQSLKDMESSEK